MNAKPIQIAAVATLLTGALRLAAALPSTAPGWPEVVVEAVDRERGFVETRAHRRDADIAHRQDAGATSSGDVGATGAGGPGLRLVLAEGLEPLAWCDLVERGPTWRWRLPPKWLPRIPVDRLRAWVIDDATVSRTMADWPSDAECSTSVDSIGPGARMVWVAAGERQGVNVGDVWLRRGGGQPLARLEVFLVTPSLSACRVVPLVSDLRLAAGDGVSRWPTPAARRAGLVMSAVAFVEEAGDAQMLWIAATPGADPQAVASVDVFRDGQYVAFAPIERRDDRFWYARTLPAAAARPVRVGDDVRVRSTAAGRSEPSERANGSAPRERRASHGARPEGQTVASDATKTAAPLPVAAPLTARVFQLAPEPLISAGEQDGLAVGSIGEVYRNDRRLGLVRVVSVQPAYAVVRPDAAEMALERLDEVRFGPPPPEEALVGRVAAVVDATLLQVKLDAPRRPISEPLAIRSPAGRLLGVALVIAQEGDAALAIVPESLLTAAIAPGSLLMQRGAESGAEQASQRRPR